MKADEIHPSLVMATKDDYSRVSENCFKIDCKLRDVVKNAEEIVAPGSEGGDEKSLKSRKSSMKWIGPESERRTT